ncbi:endonuclease/exonuclease/phosphatase family protein [Candidatus Woesearchaeota archaeon]|nr:endonuclease/exonuclease/phosphatase family protein [Candidatus Woesearchaeota archaeon]
MVKLVCYNIEYCEGIQGKWYQYLKFWRIFFPPKGLDQKIVDALKKNKPDILALVEVDTGSIRSRKKNEVQFFEHELGMKDFVEKIKYPLKGWLKFLRFIPILRKQANAIISKYKISHVKYHMLNEGTKRVVIEATIHCPKAITLLLVHLALGRKTRKKQLNELIKIVNNIKKPVVLMGDFNTFNGATEIKKLLKKTNLKDNAKLHHHSICSTQPSIKPKRRLDYVLTSKKIKVKRYEVLKYPFSDHMPVFVEFVVK